MADRVATFSGVMIRPGVSKNKRLYTTEAIGKAVTRMQERLSNPGSLPITMYGSHGEANGDSALGVAARITKVTQAEDGAAHFEAEVPDTATGRDMASLLTAKTPYLGGVSIRGRWLSPVTTVEKDGNQVSTADDMDILGLDFTNSPGVEGAKVLQASLAEAAGNEDLMFESIEDTFFDDVNIDETEDAEITVTEGSTSNPKVINMEQLIEALVSAADIAETVQEGGDAPGNGKKPYGNVTYADPGYQADKKKRYPIDTESHVRAAWSYINQSKNASSYSSSQLSAIKGRIKSAAKKFGINIESETEQLTADILQVLEAYASMCVDNGGGSVSVSGYTDDAGKLAPMAQRIALATLAGLNALDPDADGDIDLGNGDSSSSKQESEDKPDDDNMEAQVCVGCNAAVPAGAVFCPTCASPLASAESKSDAAPITEEIKEAQVAEETQTPAAETEESAAATDTAEATASPAPAQIVLSQEQFATLLASVAPKPVEVVAAPKEDAPAEAETEVKEEKEEVTTEETQTFSAAQVQEMLAAARKEAIEQASTPERQGFVNTGNPTRSVSESAEGPSEKELSEMSLGEIEALVSENVTHSPQWGGLRARLENARQQYVR